MGFTKDRVNTITAFIGFSVFMLVVAGCGGCCIFAGKGFEYSSGYRDGHIQKFARKGMLAKTWEGELALPGFKAQNKDQILSNVFNFTVDDDAVRAQLESVTADDLVRVHYDQRVCYSPLATESGYFVTKIEKLKK